MVVASAAAGSSSSSKNKKSPPSKRAKTINGYSGTAATDDTAGAIAGDATAASTPAAPPLAVRVGNSTEPPSHVEDVEVAVVVSATDGERGSVDGGDDGTARQKRKLAVGGDSVAGMDRPVSGSRSSPPKTATPAAAVEEAPLRERQSPSCSPSPAATSGIGYVVKVGEEARQRVRSAGAAAPPALSSLDGGTKATTLPKAMTKARSEDVESQGTNSPSSASTSSSCSSSLPPCSPRSSKLELEPAAAVAAAELPKESSRHDAASADGKGNGAAVAVERVAHAATTRDSKRPLYQPLGEGGVFVVAKRVDRSTTGGDGSAGGGTTEGEKLEDVSSAEVVDGGWRGRGQPPPPPPPAAAVTPGAAIMAGAARAEEGREQPQPQLQQQRQQLQAEPKETEHRPTEQVHIEAAAANKVQQGRPNAGRSGTVTGAGAISSDDHARTVELARFAECQRRELQEEKRRCREELAPLEAELEALKQRLRVRMKSVTARQAKDLETFRAALLESSGGGCGGDEGGATVLDC